MIAESVALPLGLLSTAYLTRQLGPDAYGRFSVVATLVSTLEWLVIAVLARATVKFVAEATDWQPVAATAFRAYLGAGAVVGIVLWAAAGPVAAGLQDPSLATYLRLFAVEIPIFAVATAFRNILAGLGSFSHQALTGAARWVARLALIVVFIELGLAVDGAILGSIGGIVIAASLGQLFVGRAVWGRADFPARDLWNLAAPVFLLTLSARLFDRLGLLALQALGDSTAETGFYGASQNVLMLSGVVSAAVSPILLSTLAASRRAGTQAHADRVADLAVRASVWLLPFAALVAGSSTEIVALLFGPAFAAAAPLVAWLIFTAVGLVVVSVASAVLIAVGRPWPAIWLTAPLLPVALVGHVLLIPRFGALGAAAVTTSTALLGAAVCLAVACWCWPLKAPLGALARSGAVSLCAYAAAAAWPATGLLLVVKGVVLCVAVVASAALVREFTVAELKQYGSSVFRRNGRRGEGPKVPGSQGPRGRGGPP